MERLIICGGGHVALELAHIAARLGFTITVIDDRAEFANRERFPMAAQVLAMPFLEALDQVGGGPGDYFVIVTRGHQFDQDCLVHVLRGEFGYVGMIGSRGKVAAVMKHLEELGFPRDLLERVHSPIGLRLGGQSPAEVAVSIAAELVQVRAERGPAAVPQPAGPGVLCTIVKKTGSAPRGEGSWMLVRPDGTCEGTIGGGAVEYQAVQDALALWAHKSGPVRTTYDLSPGAAELGMVCGGKIDVLLEVKE